MGKKRKCTSCGDPSWFFAGWGRRRKRKAADDHDLCGRCFRSQRDSERTVWTGK